MSRDCACNITEQCVSNVTLALIVVGICLTLSSLLWPIEPYYIPDRSLSAQENEQRQQSHANAMLILDSVSVVGMGLLTLGAIITSVLVTKLIVIDQCFSSSKEKQQQGSQKDCRQQIQQNKPSGSNDSKNVEHLNLVNMNVSSEKDQLHLPGIKPHNVSKTEKTTPSESDQLDINKDFSGVKPYGSLDH